jgi:hypothetical protein
MAWCRTALEHLDDDHAAAAAWTRRLVVIGGLIGGLVLWLWRGEQFAGAHDVVGAGGFGTPLLPAGYWSLLMPRLLNYIIAIYLILVGVIFR